MAHFAELESKTDPTGFTSETHLVVKRVVVVANDVSTAAGPLGENDCHADGETWCVNFFGGGTWKQTSYSGGFRKQFAGVGYTYDSTKDVFIIPKPVDKDGDTCNSWTLNSDSDWVPPITYPSDGKEYYWDESVYQGDNSKGWIES